MEEPPHFEIVKIEVPGDGNCFFHAVMLGCIKAYIDNPAQRHSLVMDVRRELANFLTKVQPNGKIGYDILSRGELRKFAEEADPDYTLANMQRLLLSNACVGLEVIELTSTVLDVNIILWDDQKKDIYRHGDKELIFQPHRSNVVILYQPGHYCLLGCKIDGKIHTHFTTSNAFIQYLNRLW